MNSPQAPLTVIIVGLGQMGRSYALSYRSNPDFTIFALVNRSEHKKLPTALRYFKHHPHSGEAHSEARPGIDLSHVDSHAEYAIAAMESGAQGFVKKPLVSSLEDSRRVIEVSERTGRKLIVGYVLRHHPSWQNFIRRARELEAPFVFRMNLNQQSRGAG
ncbi:hypothetical protein DOTSEDRAFT_21850 [Dothistroma septosporum NZE10]|uniref:Gfo/Idh/MocA-like oxidoreductase N-terminal domain-containing protein n=1 Tax=Dothistroma septosporum (strain NZE10 / CBS 128990) TaxID=675120 RepID=N1PXK5_DOTSN|nr:hypothetical protein DOTSEDRAFT_21850 [Dothistroma septosporum NZE10]